MGGNPVAPHADETAAAAELRRKKRRKCIIHKIAFFVVSNVVINTIMALTIMKARNPTFRVREATIAAGAPANASLSATLNALLAVKNTNFGRYSYRNATVVFKHRGTPAGEVHVSHSEVGWRSTREFNVKVNLNLNLNLGSNPVLREDWKAGIVPITSEGKLRGRADIMVMMKRRKSANMKCAMEIIVRNHTLQITNIFCK